MAYLREIASECEFFGCTRSAAVRVFNRVNALQGSFCRKHGAAVLKQLQGREEVAEWAERRVAEAGGSDSLPVGRR